MRLEPLAGALGVPVLVINDSPIKQFAENEHAVGQSVLESYMRITNQMTNGRRVAVFGYGACGKGVAANFRGANAQRRGRRERPGRAAAGACSTGSRCRRAPTRCASADIVVTVTGAADVITAADLPLLKDGADPRQRRPLPARDRRARPLSVAAVAARPAPTRASRR